MYFLSKVASKPKIFLIAPSKLGDPKDIGQMLKCEAVHKGYEKQQLEAWNNIAKAQLNLQFKPWVEICVFNEAKIGQLGIVTCMFRSNPKPTKGQWNMENIIIQIGIKILWQLNIYLIDELS